MDVLNALLPNDYYIKNDYLLHINRIYINYYMENIINLLNLNPKEIKPRNIIEKLYDNVNDKINKFYSNNKIIIEDCSHSPFFLLYEEPSEVNLENIEITPVNNEIIIIVKDFFSRFLGYNEIEVNKNNVMNLLEEPINIEENKILVETYVNYCGKFIHKINLDIIQTVINSFNNNIINMDYNEKEYLAKNWEHVKLKLFIFFKVIGKEFMILLNEPIFIKDPFCITFIKYNKIYISNLRLQLYEYYSNYENNNQILLDNISNYDACFLLFVFCRNNDSLGNFIETFIKIYDKQINNFIQRSITFNGLYNFE